MRLFLIVAMILIIPMLVAAQAQQIEIPSDSEEYQTYSSCISSCFSCEARCQDYALQSYAERNLDLSFCSKLGDEPSKELCEDNINSALAISSKDQAKCNLVKDEGLKNSCKLVILQQAAVESGNTGLCSTLPIASRENCISQVNFALAIKNNDALLCNKIQMPLQQECINSVSESKAISVPQQQAYKAISVESRMNWSLIGGIAGGAAALLLLAIGIIFLIKRKPAQEAPLVFSQQAQPSQLSGKIVPLQQAQQDSQNININKLQDALKKVEL